MVAAVALAVLQNEPCGHARHIDSPGTGAQVPTPHTVVTDKPATPAVDPAGASKHALKPEVGANVPAKQAVGEAAPAGQNEPALQTFWVADGEPAAHQYPWEQASQLGYRDMLPA